MRSGLWTGGNRRYQAVTLQSWYALRFLSSTSANVSRALEKNLLVLEATHGSFRVDRLRKKAATATEEVRYATKYLDTHGTSGISGPDFGSYGAKGLISRIHDGLLDVVRVSHLEFTHALPRRNFGEYVEEEEWLRAMLLQFDSVVRLVGLEMEQFFWEDISTTSC